MTALATPDALDFARRERARVADLADRVARLHGLREFRNSDRNLVRLLRSAGADEAAVRRVRDRLGRCGARSGAFDHGRMFGRGGAPTLLVGHPYQLTAESHGDLDAIRGLGLDVRINGASASFYGFGTLQVLVMARPRVELN